MSVIFIVMTASSCLRVIEAFRLLELVGEILLMRLGFDRRRF